ncbi:MAG: 5-carboxymethyl-2-hydroxymuconate semialdehyde dehydrogenase [Actinomycetia bacterium]|nr:5-carboxymethyl-2-hydroxymuconate semialdehyde dehydrogenase [Actinomycetes bacterium]
MLPETVRHFIGGKHVYSTLRKSYGVTDPATGKEYAQVEVGLGADINQAVLAARDAMETGPWPGMATPDRARVLSGIADAIDARADDIAAAQVLGPGLPVTQAREQAARASGLFRLVAGLVAERAADSAPGESGQSGYVVARPVGVAGLVTSWRTPFLSQARAVAPALAAGCTIVLKPDEWAPLPAALLAKVATAAGLPDGVLNIVHGSLHRKAPGAQARDALIAHPGVARLSFADEADPGQQVTPDEATHGKNRTAGLAGGSPCLIFADADLDQAADGALFGAFALNGQRRTATSTILVQRPVYDILVSRLAQRAERIRVGDPADPATQVGALPHADQYDKLSSLVRLGIREGARLAAGGRRPAGLPEGNFLAATVLADVAPSMQIFAKPVCGPVIRVTLFDTDEEAVSLANAVSYPAAYIWTADLQRARRLAPAIESASIWVNSHNPRDLVHATPGQPTAEAGAADIDFYTRSRTMLISADEVPVPQFGA